MGIRGLNTTIKRMAPEAIMEKNFTEYKDTKMAIDCSILLYKYRYLAVGSENSHIIGFLNRIIFYLEYNILPVFIFDGIPPDAKKNTIEKRQTARKRIQNKIDTLYKINANSETERIEIDKEIQKLSTQIIYVKKYHVDDCKKLIGILGIPYTTAIGEAEKYCAFLQRNNIVDYTVSDDTDCLTFGCEKILKTSIQGKIIETNYNTILDKFEFTKEQFIDFCILSGCDYCPYIYNIGSIKAFNLIKKYNNIETIMQEKKVNFPENYDYEEARRLFLQFNDYNIIEVKRNPINIDELKNFLIEKKFKENQIIKYIKKFNSF